MNRITKVLAVAIAITMLSSMATPCRASDDFSETFVSAVYGGMVGALIGGALMVFTENPSDHYDYVAYGAASGVIAGVVSGAIKATRSLVEYENGKTKFAIPTVIPELKANSNGQTSVVYTTQLVRGSF